MRSRWLAVAILVLGGFALAAGSGPLLLFQSAGVALGASPTLNCSTGTSCSMVNGVATITASGISSVTADSPLTGAGTSASHLGCQAASGSQAGCLSSSDWSNFNGKQAAGSYLTAVTADAPLSGSGTAGSHLVCATATNLIPGCLSAADWTTFNGKGAGTVTSVNGSGPASILTWGSAVTTSGNITATAASTNANLVMAGPSSGGAAAWGPRSLVGADLPNPAASTLGGIESIAAASNQWIDSISTLGVPHQSQPAFSNISGTATYAQGAGIFEPDPANGLSLVFRSYIGGVQTSFTLIGSGPTYTSAGTGTGATVANGNTTSHPYQKLTSGSTASGNYEGFTSSAVTAGFSTDYKPRFVMQVRTDATITTMTHWVALTATALNSNGVQPSVTTPGATFANTMFGAAFDPSVDSHWLVCSSNASKMWCTASSVTYSANTDYTIVCDLNRTTGSTVTCTFNGTVGTNTNTLPGATVNLTPECSVVTRTTASRSAFCGNLSIYESN